MPHVAWPPQRRVSTLSETRHWRPIVAIILLIAIFALIPVALIGTMMVVARDGYHAVPTRPELLRRP